MKKLLSFFLLFFIGCFPLFAQKSSWQLGVKVMGELSFIYETGLPYGAGVQIVYKGKQRFGMETGFQWQRRKAMRLYVEGNPNPSETIPVDFYSNRLQVPLLFRYNTKLFNYTLGPVLDFELNSTVKPDNVDPALKNYRPYGTSAGISIGISHTFNLSGKWVLEPAFRVNYVSIDEEFGGGLGLDISLRRQLF
jgi:hypothetical protein